MSDSPKSPAPVWRRRLPTLAGVSVTLREPTASDAPGLLEILATAQPAPIAVEGRLDLSSTAELIARRIADRQQGRAFLHLVTLTRSGAPVGVFQVRALDPTFETAGWEAALLPAVRGTGIFVECAQLVGMFVFGTIGAGRLEARVLLENGRANGALRKLGAAQEGVLRRAVRRNGHCFDQVLWALVGGKWSAATRTSGRWLH